MAVAKKFKFCLFFTGRRRGERSQNNGHRNNLIMEPPTTSPSDIFLSENCTQVFAQTGTTPVLHCEVGDIGESVVSFIFVNIA